MYQKTYTGIIEHTKGSLKPLVNIIEETFAQIEIANGVKHTDTIMHFDFVILEITNQKHITHLTNLCQDNVKVITAVLEKDLIPDVISTDATAIVLPPYHIKALHKAILKATQHLSANHLNKGIEHLIQMQAIQRKQSIIVNTECGFEVIHIHDIIRIEAERAYCHMHLFSGRKLIISKPLKEIEASLPQNIFFRSHISHLVNVNAIQAYRKDDGGMLLLNDNSVVAITKAKKQEVVRLLT